VSFVDQRTGNGGVQIQELFFPAERRPFKNSCGALLPFSGDEQHSGAIENVVLKNVPRPARPGWRCLTSRKFAKQEKCS
jgi:hypothetical protein